MVEKRGYIYILTNTKNTVLYIGVTSNLVKRIYEHKSKAVRGFTSKYKLHKLVYFEVFEDISNAISREKQLKGWVRSKKLALIKAFNPYWNDLYASIF